MSTSSTGSLAIFSRSSIFTLPFESSEMIDERSILHNARTRLIDETLTTSDHVRFSVSVKQCICYYFQAGARSTIVGLQVTETVRASSSGSERENDVTTKSASRPEPSPSVMNSDNGDALKNAF